MATKNVLIVFAHQSATSFCAAAKDVAVEVLKGQGCNVVVSDLYAMKFKAVANQEDIVGELKNPQNFRYAEEMMLAWQDGRLSPDIVEEQKKVTEADLIILHFPMYWFSFPGVLKGWVDRVLTLGFAHTCEKRYSQGIFRDKRIMLSFTTGSCESMFSCNGVNGDMNVTLWPIQNGILHYCGFQVLGPQIFWAPPSISPEERESMLSAWRTRLQGLLSEPALTFPLLECFDPGMGFKLKPEVHEKHVDASHGLTVGQHLGKALPPNSQLRAGI
ncbi:NAD(P)H dehydrogenase [quinone] 1-like [Chanos chanos]|uniref:Ribosyldihydronicotinamide dehydrogenase [quinone] n=1 Tax=Chanos chanos TaxID=29144 RepID=A0A6J2WG01_CHACN|nr:NAD(P)H dehydrogenase [quinone] 1-like [Chanos chanos]